MRCSFFVVLENELVPCCVANLKQLVDRVNVLGIRLPLGYKPEPEVAC